jgi:hypothetical protein
MFSGSLVKGCYLEVISFLAGTLRNFFMAHLAVDSFQKCVQF